MTEEKPPTQVITPMGMESLTAFGSDPKQKYVEVVLIRAGMRNASGSMMTKEALHDLVPQIAKHDGVDKVWVKEDKELRAVVALDKVGRLKV